MGDAAGYSGALLMKKLGAKPGAAALYVAVPETIAPLHAYADWGVLHRADSAAAAPGGPFDFIHVFETEAPALAAALPALKRRLSPAGMIWASWPKKAAKVPTTLGEDAIRAMALGAGLVDVKVCAVDAVWSGLKLVIPVKDRPEGAGSAP
ncbi:MAG: DUF3052 domain-containing protein [Maricaulaceae bacterium]|nr:DUF3052 domain-containing protein [Maricaulaceae bacterium]